MPVFQRMKRLRIGNAHLLQLQRALAGNAIHRPAAQKHEMTAALQDRPGPRIHLRHPRLGCLHHAIPQRHPRQPKARQQHQTGRDRHHDPLLRMGWQIKRHLRRLQDRGVLLAGNCQGSPTPRPACRDGLHGFRRGSRPRQADHQRLGRVHQIGLGPACPFRPRHGHRLHPRRVEHRRQRLRQIIGTAAAGQHQRFGRQPRQLLMQGGLPIGELPPDNGFGDRGHGTCFP